MSWNDSWWGRTKKEQQVALPPLENVRVRVRAKPKPTTIPQQATVTCPHCNKTGGRTVMARWHFDRCKEKKR